MKSAVLLLASLACFAADANAQGKPVFPQSASRSDAELGSPAIDAGDYVYVSGQGPRRADGSIPDRFAEQARQSLNNIKTIVEAAGLNMEHVVYVQVFVEDIKHFDELNEVFSAYFPKDPPARAILGVSKVPGPAMQISAVAVRDLKGKQAVAVPELKPSKAFSAGMLTYDRLFVSSMFGSDPATGQVPADPLTQVNLALDGVKSVTQAAGLSLANMVFVNPYLTANFPMRVMNEQYAKRFEFGNTPARATIEVASLPEGAHISYTGVAVRDLSQRRAIRPKNMPPSPTASPCVFAGDTLYCSAKSGFIPGPNGGIYTVSTSDQTRQTMRNLLDNLEEADMTFDQVVSTTIYLDDLSEWSLFGKVYRKYFNGTLPGRTTVQQIPHGSRELDKEEHYPTLEQMSLIAVRARQSKPFN
jgi:reactive intermediate/imine deaminase